MRKFISFSIFCFFLSIKLFGGSISSDNTRCNSKFNDQLLDSIEKMEILRLKSPLKSLEFGKKVIKLTRIIKDHSLIALAEKTQAVSYFYQAKYDIALVHYNNAIYEFQKSGQKLEIGKVFNNIAIIYRRTSKSELALENYLIAKKIYEEEDYTVGIASVYTNIGSVYFSLDNFKEAEENFLMALSLLNDIKKDSKLVMVNMNLGALYMEQGHYNKAFKFLNQANILSKKFNVNKRVRGNVLINLGEIAFYKKEYEKSLKYYNRCEQIRKEINDYWGLPKNYLFKAKCLTVIERYDEALDVLKKSEEICLKYKLREDLQRNYLQKAIIFQKKQDFEKALDFYQKQVVLSDSLSDENRSKRLEELQLTHYVDLKEKELAIKNLTISRKNILLIALISFILLATAFVFYFFKSRSNRNKLQILSLEQKIILSQMNPHFLFNSLVVIQKFITNKDYDKAKSYLYKFSGLINGVLKKSNQKFISVREELSILSIYADLQNLRFDNNIKYRFDIDSKIDLDEVRIPPMLAQPIIENALVNGELRNKPNAEIKIYLLKNEETNCIDFTVEDNGVGVFNLKKEHGVYKSMVTDIIMDRIQIYNNYSNNKLNIEVIDLKTLNEDLQGTRVCFSIPLNKS